MERGRRTRCYYRDIVQVFSVSIQLKDQPIFDFPLSLTIGDTGSRLSPLSLQNQLLSPLPRWSNQDKTVKLYGTIKIISQGFHEELLFEQDKQKPLAINSGDAIPLIFGSEVCIPCLDFFLYTQLYEADHNHEISRGYLYFGCQLLNYLSYYGKRMSSVIHGKHASATVFYTMFRKAVEAIVEAELVINGIGNLSTTSTSEVYGCVTVRYGGHDYETEYDKEHYRPTLFKRPASNGIELGEGDAFLLPLDVPRLGVPKDASSFIIEADLHILCDGLEIATLCADADFCLPDDIYDGGPTNQDEGTPDCTTVAGNKCRLQLTVTWV